MSTRTCLGCDADRLMHSPRAPAIPQTSNPGPWAHAEDPHETFLRWLEKRTDPALWPRLLLETAGRASQGPQLRSPCLQIELPRPDFLRQGRSAIASCHSYTWRAGCCSPT